MHLCFLTPEYPHPRLGKSGGIGTSIYHLAEALAGERHEVTILTLAEQALEETSGNIRLRAIQHSKIPKTGWFVNRFRLQKAIRWMVRHESLALVEAPDWAGLSAGMRIPCPLLIRCHGTDTYFGHLLGYKPRKSVYWAEKRALSGADSIVAVSEFTRTLTSQLFDIEGIQVIPNGVNPLHFTAGPGNPEGHTILYFGTLARKKGVLELPAIFRKVRKKQADVRLVLLGPDAQDKRTGESTLKLFRQMLHPDDVASVEFPGARPYAEVREFIARARVCVFPSFAECLPLSWIEAMLMQKAIVASDIGWAQEMLLHGQSGFLAHPSAHELFANHILQLLENPELASQFGEAARQSALSKYDMHLVVQQNLDWYAQSIAAFKR